MLPLSSPWFDPIRAALARVSLEPLPDAQALNAALGPMIRDALGEQAIEFEPQVVKRRGKREAHALYETRIDRFARVPTRKHLHDAMNALVWASFPRAKRALAARQHRALLAQGDPSANARTRERDVLAMIDEGAIIIVNGESRIFGHAIYEHLLSKASPVRGFAVPLVVGPPAEPEEVDRELAHWITRLDPEDVHGPGITIDPAQACGDAPAMP